MVKTESRLSDIRTIEKIITARAYRTDNELKTLITRLSTSLYSEKAIINPINTIIGIEINSMAIWKE